MNYLTTSVIFLVAFLQTYFLILEMFLWQTPKVLKAFRMTPEFAKASHTLAKNQGLYNGFLAAGLLWGWYLGRTEIQIFFLGCVAVAGIYGALTATKKIFFIQALPALIGIALVYITSCGCF